MINLEKPSAKQVKHYLAKHETLENYVLQEKALEKLFNLFPHNTDINDILLKSSTLNDFYSTNIFNTYAVAKHILAIPNLDNRLKQGDISLVDEIKEVTMSDGKKRDFYSFATKYCSHHNPIDFPIYDSYVEKVLCYFNKIDNFSSFKRAELKDYRKFKEILLDFQRYYKLKGFTLKEIDRYLWLLGKEIFPRYKN
mgnify:FL=1|jgi:hypothetical protein